MTQNQIARRPWRLVEERFGGPKEFTEQVIRSADDTVVAFLPDGYPTEGKLLLAAPELLETLKWVGQTLHQAHHEGEMPTCSMNTCQAVVAAIARAEGHPQ